MLNSLEAVENINSLVKKEVPFLFVIDYEKENNLVIPLDQLSNNEIFIKVPGFTNVNKDKPKLGLFNKTPITFLQYKLLFNKVMSEIKRGNSFLINLTVPSPIESDLNLYELFLAAEAKYKLYFNNQFAVFSPESFVTIEDGIIKTFPMKGTIKADIPNALEIIMNDVKETAEHATIVDLLRNDISMVATNVEVTRYRYADKIPTIFGPIYQISSEIQGKLPDNYKENLGHILFSLLPAGSVTGAPKRKTIEIINAVEISPRYFYTGIFGVWDTKKLVSAVMIRFIRCENGNLFYHSGGGITFQSDCELEYNELIDKIYVPIC